MAADQPIRQQSYEQVYSLLKSALQQRRPVSAVYKGGVRLLCPYILGRSKGGQLQMLAYQYGGESTSGLKRKGSAENWRCIAIEKLTAVKLVDDPWVTPENYSRLQTCIATIEVEAVNLPESHQRAPR